mmetsp:Transcript_21272/g.29798  ORF Transcript_21272/g.29798 Transcript_21272/m.29798 type:complete len:199 (+) Transcript_21272:3300-3896(+)
MKIHNDFRLVKILGTSSNILNIRANKKILIEKINTDQLLKVVNFSQIQIGKEGIIFNIKLQNLNNMNHQRRYSKFLPYKLSSQVMHIYKTLVSNIFLCKISISVPLNSKNCKFHRSFKVLKSYIYFVSADSPLLIYSIIARSTRGKLMFLYPREKNYEFYEYITHHILDENPNDKRFPFRIYFSTWEFIFNYNQCFII